MLKHLNKLNSPCSQNWGLIERKKEVWGVNLVDFHVVWAIVEQKKTWGVKRQNFFEHFPCKNACIACNKKHSWWSFLQPKHYRDFHFCKQLSIPTQFLIKTFQPKHPKLNLSNMTQFQHPNKPKHKGEIMQALENFMQKVRQF